MQGRLLQTVSRLQAGSMWKVVNMGAEIASGNFLVLLLCSCVSPAGHGEGQKRVLVRHAETQEQVPVRPRVKWKRACMWEKVMTHRRGKCKRTVTAFWSVASHLWHFLLPCNNFVFCLRTIPGIFHVPNFIHLFRFDWFWQFSCF